MQLLNAQQVVGDVVRLARTNPGHLDSAVRPEIESGDFEGMVLRALNGVSDLSLDADRLAQQMIINPDSVDPHDVTIAMAQANLAVSLTKAVVDGALQAYSSIINMR